MLVEDRDRIADRVEGLFPFVLAASNRVVQPRVLHGDDDLPGDDREQPLVGGAYDRAVLRSLAGFLVVGVLVGGCSSNDSAESPSSTTATVDRAGRLSPMTSA